jgi:hypothetical protein
VVKLGAWLLLLISTGGFAFSFYVQLVCGAAERERGLSAEPSPSWAQTMAQLEREERMQPTSTEPACDAVVGADPSAAVQ